MRDFFEFECADCRCRNYTSARNRKTSSKRIELKKYCSTCRKHTVHKERK